MPQSRKQELFSVSSMSWLVEHPKKFKIVALLCSNHWLVKSSRNKKDHNDVTAAPFLVLFFTAEEKNIKNDAAVTSLRTFVHSM